MSERPNYQYWQNDGGTWEQVYAERKKRLVYYHLQELALVEYVERNRPDSVLEIGMGIGRHVRNLQMVVDTYGFDQSPTMFDVVRRTTDPAWFDSHCTLGEPTGPLPYPDARFDLVFTSEVLVHVHPEDLPELLRQMMRVSRWQVLHLEPSSPELIDPDDHNGCWYHDLVAAYASLGVRCEPLERSYESQQMFRVVLDESRPPADLSPAFISVSQTLERELQPQLNSELDAATIVADRDRLWAEVTQWKAWADDLQQQVEGRDVRIEELLGDVSRLTSQLAEQGRELSHAHAAASTLESRLRGLREEMDRTLNELDTARVSARRWHDFEELARTDRRARRSLDRVTEAERSRPTERVAPGDLVVTPQGDGEVWLLDVLDAGSPRDLHTVELPAGWQRVASEHSRNGTALVADHRGVELVTPVSPDTTVRFLRHAWSGTVLLRRADGTATVDLGSTETAVAEMHHDASPANSTLFAELVGVVTDPLGVTTTMPLAEWLDAVATRRPAAVALCHPDWRGIRASMQNLFSFTLLADDVFDERTASQLLGTLADAGVRRLVTGGFPRSYVHVVDAAPRYDIRCLATWHGSFMQIGEPYNHASMNAMLDLARRGAIERVGFVKVGMAETYAKRGIDARTVLNYLRVPPAPSSPGSLGERPSIGIWSVAPVWRKIPYAMVAACSLVDASPRLFVSGNDPALVALADELGVEVHALGAAVPQEEMPSWLAAMDLNLYVTLSECAPMLPLESLAVGVPCLLGPNAHYFDGDPYLRERLVVDEPDRHERIATFIERALRDRGSIVEHYRSEFYPSHAQDGRRSVLEFLGVPEGTEV